MRTSVSTSRLPPRMRPQPPEMGIVADTRKTGRFFYSRKKKKRKKNAFSCKKSHQLGKIQILRSIPKKTDCESKAAKLTPLAVWRVYPGHQGGQGGAKMVSTEATGLAWALASVFLFGSFAVPIKTPAMQQARVHPIVIQCYKSTACFVTSFLVLLLRDFKFSYWGGPGCRNLGPERDRRHRRGAVRGNRGQPGHLERGDQ